MSFSQNSFLLDVVRGKIPKITIMRGIGERDSIGTGAAGEDLWRGNELSVTPATVTSHLSIPTPSSAGEQMSVISESDADNGATATGVLTICVDYLDELGNARTEIVTMNGQTAVDLVADNVRFIQDIQSLTVGSSGVSAGHIRIYKKSDAGLVYSMIAAGGNQSLVPNKMVPLDHKLVLARWMASEATVNKRTRIRLRADCDNSVPPARQEGVFLFKSVMALDSSIGQLDLAYAVPALSIVKATANSQVSNAEASIHWWGFLIQD